MERRGMRDVLHQQAAWQLLSAEAHCLDGRSSTESEYILIVWIYRQVNLREGAIS
jgi:hypothetical protein